MEANQLIDEMLMIYKGSLDICLGIKEAQKTVYEHVENVPIAPAFMSGVNQMEHGPEKISFDILVSISDSSKKEKNGEAKITVIRASIGSETATETSSAHRIQFSVPFYPQALERYNQKSPKN